MTDSWSIQPLRDYLRTERKENLRVVLESLSRYANIFLFNHIQARDALKGIVNEEDSGDIEELKFLFGDSERQSDFDRARLKIEVHALGAAQAARSLLEVFAFLVNATVLSPPLTEVECSSVKLLKVLPDGEIKGELNRVLQSDAFRYIDGFFNVSKHRFLVQHSFRVSFEGLPSESCIEGFSYKADVWGQKTLTEFLLYAIELKNSIVPLGRALDSHLLGGNS